jgi:starch phosphorylase
MMKTAMRNLGPFFSTTRMVQQYTTDYYMPHWERVQKMLKPSIATGQNYADWRNQLEHAWHQVNIQDVVVGDSNVKVGGKSEVIANVHLGSLTPDNVRVQLYVGKLDTRGDIIQGEAIDMDVNEEMGNGMYSFKAVYKFADTGELGLSVRVLPYHEFMSTSFQPHLITWA